MLGLNLNLNEMTGYVACEPCDVILLQ